MHRNDYYDRHAYRYASAATEAPPPPFFERFLHGLPPQARVAELGCGAGRELARLAKAGLDCRGFDLSPALAAVASRDSGAPVLVRDMRDLRLRPGRLDGVLAADSLFHLGEDELPAMLAAIARWLKCGGLFLATMMAGRGTMVDAAGRRFLLVEAAGWRAALGAAGFEIVAQSSAADPALGSRHAGIATLARKAR